MSYNTQQRNCDRCGSDNAYADYEEVKTILGTLKIWVDRCEQEGTSIRNLLLIPSKELGIIRSSGHGVTINQMREIFASKAEEVIITSDLH